VTPLPLSIVVEEPSFLVITVVELPFARPGEPRTARLRARAAHRRAPPVSRCS